MNSFIEPSCYRTWGRLGEGGIVETPQRKALKLGTH